MPYGNIDELPEPIKKNLPKDAQEIYMKAFNNAFENYVKKRKDPEILAYKIAWSAVKKKYYKNEKNKWVRR